MNRIHAVIIVMFAALFPVFLSAAEDLDLLKNPSRYIGTPEAGHAVANRQFQGIPSLAVSSGGRLWSVWYAGITPNEDENNYVVVSTSADGGETWKEVLVVDPDGAGPVRSFDPEVWMAPDGRLFLFWAQAVGHDGSVAGVWSLTTDSPDAENPQWSGPRRLTDGIMMCKPVVLSTGEWVLPVSTWKTTDYSARMVVSKDSGETWAVRGACNIPVDVRAYDEHMIVERKDGTLWMLVRTKYGIGESVSMDRGATWTALTPSDIPHTSSRFFITRLASGNLLMVKHGSMAEKTGRSRLTAFLSHDDGKTWAGGLLLDQRRGISYPDGQQCESGLIRVVYDYERRADMHILMAAFMEQDVILKDSVSETIKLNQLVSGSPD